VATLVEREVVEWDEYTARLEAVELVEVRARVSGYLDAVRFQEGAMVAAGDLLFVIDPRPYQAALRRAKAELGLAEARAELARKNGERAAKLIQREVIAQEEADARVAAAREAEAAVRSAAAAVEAARLEVEFTQVSAPIGGRISRTHVTEGNLVNGGSGTEATLLTTIVSLDPIHAYFEADERSYLKYVRLAKNGERPSSREARNPVRVGLADEDGFPHEGAMDFVDNRLDPATGTITGRAVLPNPDLLLSPGLFVRLRLPGSGRYRALLVPDEAIGTDQAEQFVWVVDTPGRAQYRRVRTGPIHDGLRIVREGLQPADRVVVAGVQRVRAGSEVAVAKTRAAAELARGAAAPSGSSRRVEG
jgi:RND family efflux transporter MFP subunit